MKWLVIGIIGLLLLGGTLCFGVEFSWHIPNAEPITMIYDNRAKKWDNCITAKIFTIGDFEGRIGGGGSISSSLVGALTYDIKNLEKLSLFGKPIVVEGIIKDIPMTVGFFASYDFNADRVTWGEMILSLQIGIK